MHRLCLWFCWLLLVTAMARAGDCPRMWMGADVSWLPELEAGGAVFRDGGAPQDALAILKRKGVNLIRLRVWHNPKAGWCDTAHTLAMAKRAAALGMDLLIDFHYSDWWADPGKQTKPEAWTNLTGAALETAVHDYTRDVVKALSDQGTPPRIVQVGNEITPGMLWPDGRLANAWDPNWTALSGLLKAAVRGVRDGLPATLQCYVMLHIDRGGDAATAQGWFDSAVKYGVPFDIIGLSYYPWWHGRLMAVRANVKNLATRFDKPVMLVETAYPWTLSNGDSLGNLVGPSSALETGYPATPEGQLRFLQSLTAAVASAPNGRGAGIVYWEPLAAPAPGWQSPWDNTSLFDFSGNALPGLEAFSQGEAIRSLVRASGLAAVPAAEAGCVSPGGTGIADAVAAIRAAR
jgi:arabinogalactan endo-1,4-beta-galactosidase